MLFAEDDTAGKQAQRKSVAEPATPSHRATKKVRIKQTSTGKKAPSFAGLMDESSGLCHLVVVRKISTDKPPEVTMIAEISPTQKQAFELLNFKPQ